MVNSLYESEKAQNFLQNNLIIFGAGASYGAGKSHFRLSPNESREEVPPLGDGLFSGLQKFDPTGWGALDKNFSVEFQGDFERGMQKLAKNNPHAMGPLQRAMARYFFNFYPDQTNLYVKLAQKN